MPSVTYRAVIHGKVASKANSRRLVLINGRMVPVKSKEALRFEKDAAKQLRRMTPLLEGPVRATFRIFYDSERPDLDESLVLDVLQGYAYKNDRQVRERHCYHGVDKIDPRVEILIEPLVPQQATLAVQSDPLEV